MPVSKRLLLDTDIVIQLLKKSSDVLECFIGLHEQGVEFYLSPIVIAEQLACPLWTHNKKHYLMSEIVLFEGL